LRSGSILRTARRLVPLLYLIPIAYVTWPTFWAPIDDRFYSYFHSKRAVEPWTEVVVVGIDRETRDTVLERPAYPLSRHVEKHAEVTRTLDAAGARAIVFDLAFGSDTLAEPPEGLAEAFRQSGKAYLVMSFRDERRVAESGETTVFLMPYLPDSLLISSSNGAYVADVRTDPDGIVRRFGPDERLRRIGVETLPERLANTRLESSIPIEFPSVDQPVPVIAYKDVVERKPEALDIVTDRIAFIGLLEEPARDYVNTPRLQDLGRGVHAFGQHGVVVLAAITETLLRGVPLRDAGTAATLLWVVLWSVLVIVGLPRRRPAQAALMLLGIVVVALIVTGFVHVKADLIFPAGLLFGVLFVTGTHTLIVSYVETTKELHAEEVENERVRLELETARRTQETFLPEEIPVVEGLDIWGANVSCLEVSGDYYDMVDLGPERPLVITIADVSGKGLPAALLMSNVQAGLHSHVLQEQFDLETTVSNLNRLVHRNTESGKFITLFLCEIDKETCRLRYVSAGHDAPIVVSADGNVRKLEEGGLVLGFMAEAPYAAGEEQLAEGDVLCLYTDGATEARNPEGEEFELDRIAETVKENSGLTAEEIGRALLGRLAAFSQLSQQADDVTLVILKVARTSCPAGS